MEYKGVTIDMHYTKLRKNSAGVAPMAVIGIIVILLIIGIGVVVATHSSKSDTDQKTAQNGTQPTADQSPAATQAVSDITFASPITYTMTKFPPEQITAANTNKASANTRFVKVTNGYAYSDSGQNVGIEWGTSTKVPFTAKNYEAFLKTAGSRTGQSLSFVVTKDSNRSIKGSDGKSYDLTCNSFVASSGGQTVPGLGCAGTVQKSLVYAVIEATDATTVQDSMANLLSGATLDLQ